MAGTLKDSNMICVIFSRLILGEGQGGSERRGVEVERARVKRLYFTPHPTPIPFVGALAPPTEHCEP